MQRKFDPTPNAIQSSPGAALLNEAKSVSTVRLLILSHTFCTAPAACRYKLVLASYDEHVTRRVKYDQSGEQRTSVAYRFLSSASGRRTASHDRNDANNSVLFSSMRRKSFDLFGITVVAATLFIVPFPMFCG